MIQSHDAIHPYHENPEWEEEWEEEGEEEEEGKAGRCQRRELVREKLDERREGREIGGITK